MAEEDNAIWPPKWVWDFFFFIFFFLRFNSVCHAFGCTRLQRRPCVSTAAVLCKYSQYAVYVLWRLSALLLCTEYVSILSQLTQSESNTPRFCFFAAVLFLRSWWLGRRPQERWLQSSAFPKKLSRGRKRASRTKSPFSGSECHMTKRMFAEEKLSALHQSWVFLFLLSLLVFNSYWQVWVSSFEWSISAFVCV